MKNINYYVWTLVFVIYFISDIVKDNKEYHVLYMIALAVITIMSKIDETKNNKDD